MLAALGRRSSENGRKRPTSPITRRIAAARTECFRPGFCLANRESASVDRAGSHKHGQRVGRHLFICTNGRSSGKPACGPRGGDALVAAVQHQLLVRGATDVLVTPCGCLGPCFDGPNAVVYPDGVWYGGLAPDDAE